MQERGKDKGLGQNLSTKEALGQFCMNEETESRHNPGIKSHLN
jgi:hypothetical protein